MVIYTAVKSKMADFRGVHDRRRSLVHCPHCDTFLSAKTYARHKTLYYVKDSNTWISLKLDDDEEEDWFISTSGSTDEDVCPEADIFDTELQGQLEYSN